MAVIWEMGFGGFVSYSNMGDVATIDYIRLHWYDLSPHSKERNICTNVQKSIPMHVALGP